MGKEDRMFPLIRLKKEGQRQKANAKSLRQKDKKLEKQVAERVHRICKEFVKTIGWKIEKSVEKSGSTLTLYKRTGFLDPPELSSYPSFQVGVHKGHFINPFVYKRGGVGATGISGGESYSATFEDFSENVLREYLVREYSKFIQRQFNEK